MSTCNSDCKNCQDSSCQYHPNFTLTLQKLPDFTFKELEERGFSTSQIELLLKNEILKNRKLINQLIEFVNTYR